MVRFFIRKFGGDPERPGYRQRVGVLSGIVNVLCNIFLFIIKLIIGMVSGSVAVTADAFNNLSDTGSALVTIAGFKLSNKAPDQKHPFGYGRTEYVAGVVVSVLILMVGFQFVQSSVDKILHPAKVEFNLIMLIALLAAVAVKLWMGYANNAFGKAMGGSSTVKAVMFDSLSDVATTTVAIISLVLSRFVGFPIDGYLGVLIALAVLIGGIKILLDTISPLLGQPPSPELVTNIRELVLGYEEIVGIHDIVIHNYGANRVIATLHAEVPANNNILFAHEIIDRAEREIGAKLGITVLMHLDPIVTDDRRVNEVRQIVVNTLAEINPAYDMHDFRMLDGRQQINLIFDVLVPYRMEMSDEQVEEEIIQRLKSKDSRFHPIITVDKSFLG